MTPITFNWHKIDAKLEDLPRQILAQRSMVEREIVSAQALRGEIMARLDKSERVMEQLKNTTPALDDLIGSMCKAKRENARLLDDLHNQSKLHGIQPAESKSPGNIVWRITKWLRLTLLRRK